MTFYEIWDVASPFIAAFFGATIALLMNEIRDVRGQRRKLEEEYKIAAREAKRTHLLAAFKLLDSSFPDRLRYLRNNGLIDEVERASRERSIGEAIGIIKIFGGIELNKLADEYVDSVSKNGKFDLRMLLNALRNEIRSEYGIEVGSDEYRWLEIKEIIYHEHSP